MTTSLIETLESYGFEEKVYTRIGIDYGDDNDTLWSMAGQGNVSEITTTGLHTSLAAKMQANAQSNGIVVGDHIVEMSSSNYFKPCCNRNNVTNPPKRYIFQNEKKGFRYTQYDFNWNQYLRESEQIVLDSTSNRYQLKLKNPNQSSTHLLATASMNKPYFVA